MSGQCSDLRVKRWDCLGGLSFQTLSGWMNTCYGPEWVSGVYLLLKVTAGETPLSMEWCEHTKRVHAKCHKVQRSKSRLRVGSVPPFPCSPCLNAGGTRGSIMRRRNFTQENGKEIKHIIPGARGGEGERGWK